VSAAIVGNYAKMKGSRWCTALRSQIGAWLSHLFGGCRHYKNTHNPANIFAITTGSSNEQTDMIPQLPSTNEIFGWAYGPFKYKQNYSTLHDVIKEYHRHEVLKKSIFIAIQGSLQK
jgi:hypothetical protein